MHGATEGGDGSGGGGGGSKGHGSRSSLNLLTSFLSPLDISSEMPFALAASTADSNFLSSATAGAGVGVGMGASFESLCSPWPGLASAAHPGDGDDFEAALSCFSSESLIARSLSLVSVGKPEAVLMRLANSSSTLAGAAVRTRSAPLALLSAWASGRPPKQATAGVIFAAESA